MTPEWESYVASRFPGYLLPDSAHASLSPSQAERFLGAIASRSDALQLLRAASLLAPRVKALEQFVEGPLTQLVRTLPSRNETTRREWNGGYHGRLHVGETLAARMRGRTTTFVTFSRCRTFQLPENLLVRHVCVGVIRAIELLRRAEALRDDVAWAYGLRSCEGKLRALLTSTALRDLRDAPVGVEHFNAARGAMDRRYRIVLEWAEVLLRHNEANGAELARLMAQGALLPLKASTRFELAVTIRLAEALHEGLQVRAGSDWQCVRNIIQSGRRDIVAFERGRAAVRVYYNQSVLPSGLADAGTHHYLASDGRLRPDIVVTFNDGTAITNAIVIECKDSSNGIVLRNGYREAVLYRWEYKELLHGRTKAVLVASSTIPGELRPTDEVIAVDWNRWPPVALVEELLENARQLISGT